MHRGNPTNANHPAIHQAIHPAIGEGRKETNCGLAPLRCAHTLQQASKHASKQEEGKQEEEEEEEEEEEIWNISRSKRRREGEDGEENKLTEGYKQKNFPKMI